MLQRVLRLRPTLVPAFARKLCGIFKDLILDLQGQGFLILFLLLVLLVICLFSLYGIEHANDATFVWTNGITMENIKLHYIFSQKEVVKSIGNPAGIGQGTGLGLRERDRDVIGLGHYRLRTSCW